MCADVCSLDLCIATAGHEYSGAVLDSACFVLLYVQAGSLALCAEVLQSAKQRGMHACVA